MSLAAYFFFKDHCNDDPNLALPPEVLDHYRMRGELFSTATTELMAILAEIPKDTPEKDIQFYFYETAKKYYGTDGSSIRLYFKDLYLLIWGTESGVRFGTFVSLYGINDFIELVYSRMRNPFGI